MIVVIFKLPTPPTHTKIFKLGEDMEFVTALIRININPHMGDTESLD